MSTQDLKRAIESERAEPSMIRSGEKSFVVVVTDQKTGKPSTILLNMSDEQEIAEFTEVLRRAIGIWDRIPTWAQALHDKLNRIPAPAQRIEP